MTLSTAMAIASRVAVTGLLTVSCFKRAVVDNTAQVLAKVEKASVGLVVYSVCLSTITLVLAADKAAQRILSNEPKHMPAPLKDDDADSNPPSANDPTTSESVTHQPVESSHLQPFSSPSPSRLIKSTEIIFAPISTCTPDNNIISATPKPVELYHLQPSPTSSPSRLIKSTEIISAPISTCTPNHNTISAAPKPVESYHLQPSPTSSPSRLIESTETASAPITCSNTCSSCITLTSPDLYCKRLFIDSSTTLVPHDDDPATGVFSDDASDANDCESFSDESTIHEDDCSEPKPQKEHHALEPTLDILIAKMTGLTLDDPPCPSRLRPLILVNSRHHSSTTIRYPRSLNPPTPWMH
ncbi:uncharacterized protein BJ212DRAFT_639707 [Suillus subaureus]|uniref:Uncharacterized protein n=1 Tax=Suillus subaureus TaxID=48587 RepID=A0A9P7E1L0_9AGAM|nr:uncharacterized protein BJ212DRAFT_639707 [Suillus subaureus]KAG1808608.1 hypothetical protein BJ212DRAFT_639707 [Suillus subaureus]